jgi:phage head maturation protease
MEAERRYVAFAEYKIEIESRAAGSTTVSGISPPFNSKSVDLGGFREIFAETAFDKILERYAADPNKVDVLGLYNHDDNLLLSRTTSGTLRM